MKYNFWMNIINETVKEVIEKSGSVAIGTFGKNEPHFVATWEDFVKRLDVNDKKKSLYL